MEKNAIMSSKAALIGGNSNKNGLEKFNTAFALFYTLEK